LFDGTDFRHQHYPGQRGFDPSDSAEVAEGPQLNNSVLWDACVAGQQAALLTCFSQFQEMAGMFDSPGFKNFHKLERNTRE
jgi:hypothetical protein